MKRNILFLLFLFFLIITTQSVSAQNDLDEHDKWCYYNFEGEKLEECLNESKPLPDPKAGCIFCEQ